jgi:hypothetical protein
METIEIEQVKTTFGTRVYNAENIMIDVMAYKVSRIGIRRIIDRLTHKIDVTTDPDMISKLKEQVTKLREIRHTMKKLEKQL